jgi:hypothetical protein
MKTLTVPERSVFTSSASTAFVVCAYHGDERWRNQTNGSGSKSAGWLPFRRIAENNRQLMNFYANPRTLAYQLDVISVFRKTNEIRGPVDLILDSGLTESLPPEFAAQFRKVRIASLLEADGPGVAQIRDDSYDAVVLVFADAIGLGCEKIEEALAPLPAVFVLNGRRRAFAMTAEMRHALKRRRFHSRWRLVEILLAISLVPISGLLALKDRFSRKCA